MKIIIFYALLIPSFALAQIQSSGRAAQTPWGGFWWSMASGELALGWDNHSDGRVGFEKVFAELFTKCLEEKTKNCKDLMEDFRGENGKSLSPMMKFDLWVKNQVDAAYGVGNYSTMYSRATKNEIDIHYIDDSNHPHYEAAGFAGKCTGWALASADYPEPTEAKVIDGVVFTPADIKGILSTIYYAAQFFVPNDKYLGNAYREVGPDRNQTFYNDPAPHDLIIALEKFVQGEKKIIVADMDPGYGVWNHPIYAYELDLKKQVGTKVSGVLILHYANDEVGLDEVFSIHRKRKDLINRKLSFSLTVPKNWDQDIRKVISSSWTGTSKDKHPDSLILGLESGWRKKVYEYKNTSMKQEVNFQLIKKVNTGSGYKIIVDELLKKYYK